MTGILELWDVFSVIATASVVTPSLPEAKDSKTKALSNRSSISGEQLSVISDLICQWCLIIALPPLTVEVTALV